MRRIVSRGLYTCMEGMSFGTVLTDKVEKNEPLKQTRNKRLEASSEDLAYRLKFTAWQRINSHRRQRQAAVVSEAHISGLTSLQP